MASSKASTSKPDMMTYSPAIITQQRYQTGFDKVQRGLGFEPTCPVTLEVSGRACEFTNEASRIIM